MSYPEKIKIKVRHQGPSENTNKNKSPSPRPLRKHEPGKSAEADLCSQEPASPCPPISSVYLKVVGKKVIQLEKLIDVNTAFIFQK